MKNKNSYCELHLPEIVKSGSKFFGSFIISKPIKQHLLKRKKNQQLIFTQLVNLKTRLE